MGFLQSYISHNNHSSWISKRTPIKLFLWQPAERGTTSIWTWAFLSNKTINRKGALIKSAYEDFWNAVVTKAQNITRNFMASHMLHYKFQKSIEFPVLISFYTKQRTSTSTNIHKLDLHALRKTCFPSCASDSSINMSLPQRMPKMWKKKVIISNIKKKCNVEN